MEYLHWRIMYRVIYRFDHYCTVSSYRNFITVYGLRVWADCSVVYFIRIHVSISSVCGSSHHVAAELCCSMRDAITSARCDAVGGT